MFSRRFATNRGGGGAEYGEWEGGKSAAGRGEVAVHGEVLMPLLSPALIGTQTSLSSHQGGETQLVS